jgi:ABC-type transport system substrate-binding protein
MALKCRMSAFLFVIIALLFACGAPAAPTTAPAQTAAPSPVATAAPAAPPKAATAAPVAPVSSATPVSKVKRGGTPRAQQQNAWQTADPHTSNQSGNSAELIFDSLLYYSMENGKFTSQPWLAESWDQPDAKTVVMKLAKGAKFHDGSDFNAEVARWNLLRMRDHPRTQQRSQTASLADVAVVDPYTIKITFKAPSPSFLSSLSPYGTGGYGSGMVSRIAAEKYGDSFGTSPENTVGSGPMKLVGWLKDSRQDLERFDGYWKMGIDGKPLPYYDKATFRFMPDTNIALLELKAGNLDVMERIDGKDVPGVKANPALSFNEVLWDGTIYSLGITPGVEPFGNNVKLRQALHYAIDRDSVAKIVGEGIGYTSYYWWDDTSVGYNPSLPRYDYQPEKAKQLLRDAGYPNGLDVNITIVARPQDERMSQMLKQMWDAVGFRTTIDSMERLAWQERSMGQKLQTTTFRYHYAPDADLLSNSVTTGGSGNFVSWSDPEMDKCMEEGRGMMDVKARQAVYERCQKILFDTAIYAPIWKWTRNDVVANYVKGWEPNYEGPRYKKLWLDK